jgi:glycerol-3-phosphate O-acyltransferase
MPRRLGPVLGPFARRFLDRIPFPSSMADRIRALEKSGAVIVWVHRARNPVEHLALARVVAREQLPRARYVGGLNVSLLQPFRIWPTFSASAEREEELLEACVRAGQPAEIFLRRPLTLLSSGGAFRARFMDVLVRAQRAMSRPIVLVPTFLALKQRPGNFEPTPLDAIFGTVEEPGVLRALGRVMAAGDAARFEVSEHIDLRAVVDDNKDASDDVVAKKVRWSILHHLARVERAFHGPALKSASRMRDEVLRDPALQRVVTALSTENGLEKAMLEEQARGMYDEIAAKFDVDITRVYSSILDVIWKRIYDGIEYSQAEVDRLRDAVRRGPLVLVPSHRSHIDYLVMSQVMLKSGLLPPHVAAGDNLSFFPMGPLFRRGGAYFLRRSFKGDVLYGAVFRAYVRKLFVEGFTQEFFIEGGRSRTGKTLPPKLGLLSMIVDAYLESREDDAIFLPCHISYERVIEAKSYVGELAGKAKVKESAGGLVKSAGVLGGRYGRVYVTFDEPISLASHLAARNVARESVGEDERRAAIATLAHKIVYGINRSCVVTSTSLVAAAVLGFRKKGLDEGALVAGAKSLALHLANKPRGSVRWQPGLAVSDDAELEAEVRAAVARLVDDGLLIKAEAGDRVLYQVAADAVFPLDAFKNQLLHHIVPECIVATAFAACAPGDSLAPVPRAVLAESARALSRIFKIEFIYRAGATFDELFDEAVRNAVAVGLLEDTDGGVRTPDSKVARANQRFARSLILGYVESYRAVFAAIAKGASSSVPALLDVLHGHALAGELTAPEAASKANVENAIALLRELHIVEANGAVVEAKRAQVGEMAALLERAAP